MFTYVSKEEAPRPSIESAGISYLAGGVGFDLLSQ